MPNDELAVLRRELAGLDRAIARAVAARLRVARRIGLAKRRRGIAIRNRAVERQVLGRWADEFESIGVPSERAHAFARWLVEEAVRVQETSRGARVGRRNRVLIIGGGGGMGRLLGGRLRAIGNDVRIVDPAIRRGSRRGPRVERDLESAARWATHVLVATPIDAAPEVFRRLWRSDCSATVIDIFSVKAPVRRWIGIGRRRGYRVASVHPLFGPGARTVSGERLLVVDCGDRRATACARSLFRPLGVIMEVLPLDRHDLWMSELQVLPRLASLAFLVAHRRGGRVSLRARGVATPSFRRQWEVAERVLAEAPDLSFAIQASNPHAAAARRRFARALEQVGRVLRPQAEAEYRRLVGSLRQDAGRPRRPRPVRRQGYGAAPAMPRRAPGAPARTHR